VNPPEASGLSSAQLDIDGRVIVGCVRALTQGIASGAAPPLAGPDLAGRPASLTDLRGKPVVVHFWATWCSVCDAESSTVDAVAREHAVPTVASGSGQAEEIRAAMNKRGVSFPVVVDADGEIARAWCVRAFPTSFFVTPSQQIRVAETGFTTSLGFRARLWLAGR
jgi:thiol-disulfide isomerase/thioredoxin